MSGRRWPAASTAPAPWPGLPELTTETADRAETDALIGALVRVAADDPDAALVVLHLLRHGVCRLAGKFAHRGPEVMALVVGEVVCAIRSYPWRRRTWAYAAGVLLDAKHALWHGELTPIDPNLPGGAELVDPADLLLWAVQTGAVTARAAQLLLDTETAASRHGMGGRTAAAKAAASPNARSAGTGNAPSPP